MTTLLETRLTRGWAGGRRREVLVREMVNLKYLLPGRKGQRQ